MKYIIPIIILSFVLLSCSKDEDEETQTAAEKAAAAQVVALEGTWKTACYTNSDNTSFIDTITFAGNSITGNFEKHSDTSCATDYSLEGFNWTFSIGDAVTFSNGTGHKFSITIGSTYKLIPQSASAVSAFNSKPECSKSDWELNTEIDCSTGSDAARLFYVYISLMVIPGTLNVMRTHVLQHQISIPTMHQILLLNNKFFLSNIVTGST